MYKIDRHFLAIHADLIRPNAKATARVVSKKTVPSNGCNLSQRAWRASAGMRVHHHWSPGVEQWEPRRM